MAKKLTQFSILLSSPSDLESERNEIPQVISELNQTYGNSNNIHFELIKWETHSAPGISKEYTQQIINQDIGNDYDIFIGIIWKKFGTKTAKANSGTEEEFLNALKRYENGENIQILFYFKSEAIPFNEIDPEQISKINNFKEGLKQNNVLFWNFNNIEELKNQLRIHIPKRTDSLLVNSNNSIIRSSEDENGSFDFIDSNEFGILDFVIQFEDYLANANLALNGITEATNVISEEFKNKTNELDRLQKLPNFNRNQLVGILSRTAKSVDNYTNRLITETPLYQDNFESAIKVGTLYLNSITKENIEENRESLEDLLESVKVLKSNIPNAINGMIGFYDVIKGLPNLYSVFTKSKNKLISQLETLNTTLKHSYDLTHEFEGEIEYKLKI
ncbi:DUF4062 domain-containing protein [Chryseobacterium taihuense]|uniref:DUF4062 domain-containing protein n=1 Tax=Chryseobacterium taihuense TaxID=1141221 RepID=A0ABY0QPU6_9FLAO|nr:DUF4062 domain-containing protein [Chryseobacterium taihuense]SDL45646.1 protein of unknown function [Chryseobacterium taihuense]